MACLTLKEVTACQFLFSSANLIDAIQNEPVIWDRPITVNASEEEKEMA